MTLETIEPMREDLNSCCPPRPHERERPYPPRRSRPCVIRADSYLHTEQEVVYWIAFSAATKLMGDTACERCALNPEASALLDRGRQVMCVGTPVPGLAG